MGKSNNSLLEKRCKEKFEEKCVREALAKNPRLIERELRNKYKKNIKLILKKQEYYVGRGFIDIVFKDSYAEPTYYLVEIKYKVDPLEASKISKYAVRFSHKENTDKIVKIIAIDTSKISAVIDKDIIERQLNCVLIYYEPNYIIKILADKKPPPPPPPKPPAPIPEEIVKKVEKIVKNNALTVIQSEYEWYIRGLLWKWIDEGIEDRNLLFFYSIFDGIYANTGVRLSKRIRSYEDLLKFKNFIYDFIFEPGIPLMTGVRRYKQKHKEAIPKLIDHFSEKPPVDYIRHILKIELANTGDSLLARKRVYNNLIQVLKDCGYSGEHETRYPIDILFGTQIFSGYLDASERQGKSVHIDIALRKIAPKFKWNQRTKDSLHKIVADRLGIDSRTVNLALYLYGKSLVEKRKSI